MIFDLQAIHPVLVIGTAGHGRAAAFASDIAPHWVGGFVDWGDSRVTAQAPAARPSKSVSPTPNSGGNC